MVKLTERVARLDPLIEDAGVSKIQYNAWLIQSRKQDGGRFDKDLISLCLRFDKISHSSVLFG
jgi:hypothetical protein